LFLGLVALGGGLEILQSLVGRDGEWGDFIANDLGILLGMVVAAAYLAVPRQLVEKPPRD
jgi:VanZ family protein